jgi:hypothetical protein
MTVLEWTLRKGTHSLGRYAPLLCGMQLSLFIVGSIFWVDAMMGARHFDPNTWGEFAYSFPAEMWAGWNMAASAITFVGMIDPIKRQIVIVGGTLHSLQFAILAYSITMTGGEIPVGLYSGAFFLPLHMWITWRAVTDDTR